MKNRFNRESNPYAPIYGEAIWADAGILKTFEEKTVNNLIKKHPDLMASFMDKENQGYSIPRNLSTLFYTYPTEAISKFLEIDIDAVISFSKDIQLSCNYIQYSTNCYQYALNDPTIHHPGVSACPAGANVLESNNSNDLINNIISDGALDAGTIFPNIRKGYYRIALLYYNNNKNYYHLIRENQSNNGLICSYKHGTYMPDYRDDDGKIITDIERANLKNYTIENYFHIKQGGLKTKPLSVPDFK